MSSTQYKQQRNKFNKAPQPRDADSKGKVAYHDHDQYIFVIHKHHSSTSHYEFSLEIEGVLKSWAIPDGFDKEESSFQKLAVEAEDHPIEYADFHGNVDDGEYGAGSVEIWERGAFCNLTQDHKKTIPIEQGLKEGHFSIHLEGNILNGRLTLVFMRKHKGKNQWLMTGTFDKSN